MSRLPVCSFAGLCLLVCGAARVDAGMITVLNFSFESPVQANLGGFTNTAPDDWTMMGSGGVFKPVPGFEVVAVPDGSQVGWLNGGGSFFQDLGVAVSSSNTYQLDLFVGTQLDNSNLTDSYRVDLVAGGPSGTVIAEASGTLLAKSDFIPVSIAGVGAGTGNLGVLISATGGQPLYDDVRVQSTVTGTFVPEPSTLVIWSLVAAIFGSVQPLARLRRPQLPV